MGLKTRPFEIVGEDSSILMKKFLLHFLLIEHDHQVVQLFDQKDDMFQAQRKTNVSIKDAMQDMIK